MRMDGHGMMSSKSKYMVDNTSFYSDSTSSITKFRNVKIESGDNYCNFFVKMLLEIICKEILQFVKKLPLIPALSRCSLCNLLTCSKVDRFRDDYN